MTKSPMILIRRVPLDWMVRSATLQKGIEVTYGLHRTCGAIGGIGAIGAIGHYRSTIGVYYRTIGPGLWYDLIGAL